MNLMSNIPNLNTSSIFDQEKLNSIDPLENQLCRVCEEPAAGFHFGAFTCEGCKSFFGRSCNNQTVIQECKNNYRCTVDKKNRTACKACRLRKCLMVGMSKSGCRYGRRSNWFKIHCIMQKNADKSGGAGGNNGGRSHSMHSSMPYPPQNPSRLPPGSGGMSLADSLNSLNSLQQQHSNSNAAAASAAMAALRGFLPPQKLSLSRSPSPLNTSTETLSIQSSPSPASGSGMLHEAPVSPPTSGHTPLFNPSSAGGLYGLNFPGFSSSPHSSPLHPLLMPQLQPSTEMSSSPQSLLDQANLYKLSPLLAVHPLLLAANPLFKLDFSQQFELLRQRRAMFEQALKTEDSIDVDNHEDDDDLDKSDPSVVEEESKDLIVDRAAEGVNTRPVRAESPIDLSCK